MAPSFLPWGGARGPSGAAPAVLGVQLQHSRVALHEATADRARGGPLARHHVPLRKPLHEPQRESVEELLRQHVAIRIVETPQQIPGALERSKELHQHLWYEAVAAADASPIPSPPNSWSRGHGGVAIVLLVIVDLDRPFQRVFEVVQAALEDVRDSISQAGVGVREAGPGLELPTSRRPPHDQVSDPGGAVPAAYSRIGTSPDAHASAIGSMMRHASSASSPRIVKVASPRSISRTKLA